MSESETVYFDDNTDEPQVVELIIATRKPEKWRFIDTETGNVWACEGGMFAIADDVVLSPAAQPKKEPFLVEPRRYKSLGKRREPDPGEQLDMSEGGASDSG